MKKIAYVVLSLLLCSKIALAQDAPGIQNEAAKTLANTAGTSTKLATDKQGRLLLSTTFGPVKAEDAAHTSGDSGIQNLYVRQDTPAAGTGATGRYGYGAIDSLNRQQFVWSPNATLIRGCSSAATGTADTTILNNPGGAIRYYITNISCANTSAVASEIVFKEGSTAIWRGGIGTQAANGGDYKFDFGIAPLRTSANVTFQFAMTTTATSTTCCVNGFQITD